jgi:anaerobic selenocysteine-containing dehydrogenase
MEEWGFEPFPVYHVQKGLRYDSLTTVENYPLLLTTGEKTIHSVHSQLHNLPSLRRVLPAPFVEIHPSTARAQNINDGEYILIETASGKLEINCKFSESIHPDVLSIQHGWGQANVNILTDHKKLDPVSGFPNFRSIPCRITKTN